MDESSSLPALVEKRPSRKRRTVAVADKTPPMVIETRKLIAAETDEQAIQTWLLQCSSAVTAANYRKDADRFLMWLKTRGQGLRSLVVEDLSGYGKFLAELDELKGKQAAQWISKRRWPKSDARWRPFQGPLSKDSQRQALIVVGALLRWLEKTGYVDRSPAALMKIKKVRKNKVDRYLPWDALEILLEAADQLPEENREQIRYKIRNRFLICLFALTGARLGDLPRSTMSSFYRSPDGRWWWAVTGKGDKDEKIPVPTDLLREFMLYRESMGLPALPSPDDERPLVPSLRGGGPAAESTIYTALEQIFERAADIAEGEDAALASQLRKVSPHWLRHTALTRQADMKMDLRWVQANARHEDVNTTMGYLHQDDRDRHDETNETMRLPRKRKDKNAPDQKKDGA